MAIGDDRLGLKHITNMNTVDFMSTSDVEAIEASNEKIKTNKSKITKPTGNNLSNKDKALGIVSTDTSSNISAKVKLDKANTSNKQDNKNNFISENGDPLDSILSKSPSNVSIMENKSSDMDSRVGDALVTEISTYKDFTTKLGIDKTNFVSTLKNSVINTTNSIGETLKSRTGLLNLVTDCSLGKALGYTAGSNDTISKFVLSSLFDLISCIGANEVAKFIQNELGLSDDARRVILVSIVASMNKDNDKHVLDKLMLLTAVTSIASTLSEEDSTINTKTDSLYTKGITSVVLNNIKNNPIGGPHSQIEYINTINGLNTLDPNWNKDDSGNTNYSVLNNNSNLLSLANKSSLNKEPTLIDDTGKVTTNLSTDNTIGILSYFNKDEKDEIIETTTDSNPSISSSIYDVYKTAIA